MSKPEEFTISIEADGRIVLDGNGLHETSYRRILELLEETIGPARPLAVGEDPPTRHMNRGTTEATQESLRLEKR